MMNVDKRKTKENLLNELVADIKKQRNFHWEKNNYLDSLNPKANKYHAHRGDAFAEVLTTLEKILS